MQTLDFPLPSGSNDWKTLLACSDGDSGPTSDISYLETVGTKRQDIKRQAQVKNTCALEREEV